MGCVFSTSNTAAATKRSRAIDKEIQAEGQKSVQEFKILLLGAGESGKSTLMKQAKIIHSSGYTLEERTQHRPVVLSNAIQSLQTIVRAMGQLGIGFGSPETVSDARRLFTMATGVDVASDCLAQGLAQAMRRLWSDHGVQQCLARSREYQLNDSAAYYLGSLDRLCQPDYLPTEQDVLRARVKTCGIVEAAFAHRGASFRLLDVGGQRSERKKWIHCFAGVAAVAFTVALSEYDQRLAEDQEVNRMTESLRLFDSVCSCRWFESSAVVLLLNKVDLFQAKIRQSPLAVCFPEYAGPNEFAAAAAFVRGKFERLNGRGQSREVYTHFTCATDTGAIRLVFDSVTDTIVKRDLTLCGIY